MKLLKALLLASVSHDALIVAIVYWGRLKKDAEARAPLKAVVR